MNISFGLVLGTKGTDKVQLVDASANKVKLFPDDQGRPKPVIVRNEADLENILKMITIENILQKFDYPDSAAIIIGV